MTHHMVGDMEYSLVVDWWFNRKHGCELNINKTHSQSMSKSLQSRIVISMQSNELVGTTHWCDQGMSRVDEDEYTMPGSRGQRSAPIL